jgi:hypothetical protein
MYPRQNFIQDKSSPEGSKRNTSIGEETTFYNAYILIALISPPKILLGFNRTATLLLSHIVPTRVEAYHIWGLTFLFSVESWSCNIKEKSFHSSKKISQRIHEKNTILCKTSCIA